MQPHEHYAQLCTKHGHAPDVSLQRELRARATTLHLRSDAQLTLLEPLFKQCAAVTLAHVTQLVVLVSAVSSRALSALLSVVQSHEQLTALSLAGVSLDVSSFVAIFSALANAPRSRVSRLNLASTGLDRRAATAVAPFLTGQLSALLHLDLSNNRANQHGVHIVHKYLALRDASLPPLHVDLSGNLVIVETLNALTHGVGAVVALFGAVLMLRRALLERASVPIIISIAVFLFSLFTLLTSSCVYHCCFRHPEASKCMRRADHCSIFLLIAGTYTPMVVRYTLEPLFLRGPITLFGVWSCALIGIYRSIRGLGSNRSRALFALLTGWLGSFSANTLVERMQRGALQLVFWGGVVYSVGIVFYLLGKKRPMMHVIWHIAVLLGGGLHYLAIWQYVLGPS